MNLYKFRIAFHFILLISTLVGLPLFSQDISTQTLDGLLRKWRDKSDGIINGHYVMAVYRAIGISELPEDMAAEELLEQQFRAAGTHSQYHQFLAQYQTRFLRCSESFAGKAPVWGQTIDVYFDGEYCRNTWYADSGSTLAEEPTGASTNGNAIRDLVWRPGVTVKYNPQFNSYTAMLRSTYERIDKNELLNAPIAELESYTEIKPAGEQLLNISLTHGRNILVDLRGDIQKACRQTGDAKEIWFYGPLDPTGIFPEWSLKVVYTNGHLSQFFATEILQSQLNTSMSAANFDMVIQKDQRIIDQRLGPEKQRVLASDEPIALSQLLSRPAGNGVSGVADRSGAVTQYWQMIFVCTVSAAFAVGVFLVRRFLSNRRSKW